MPKTKIAVLGGGISGLTAAFHLSRTQALRDNFDVTVHTLGFRVGGKIASGRDDTGRNLEHGLHVWFGCYDNAFAMLQDAYAHRPVEGRFKTWTDAVKPQPFTPIAVKANGAWSYWPITWPSNRRIPGQGGLQITLWDMITTMTRMLRQTLEDLALDFPLPPLPPQTGFGTLITDAFGLAAAFLPIETPGGALANFLNKAGAHNFLDVVKATHLWAEALDSDPSKHDAEHRESIVDLLTLLNQSFKQGPAATAKAGTAVSVVRDLLDIGQAFIRGLVEDILEPDAAFESLDDLEFRAWLEANGAAPDIVRNSSIIRALYDTAFQYDEGDQSKPSYAAGTAAGVLTRLITTYKGDMLWEIQSGMGEAVIAPIYDVLVARGVKFEFFRKVRRLELSADKKSIDKVHLDRQADVKGGAAYRPTFDVAGLACWGSTPDWDQLVNGPNLRANGVDFESHWDSTRAGQEVLARGNDFDDIVLAISMGAYQKLNGEAGMCDDLIAESVPFANFVKIPIVPTMSLQLWCDVTTAVLGWDMRKPAAVAGPGPLSVWADMTQVLDFEPPLNGPNKPKSLHYLCGTFKTSLFKEPSSNNAVPAQALAAVRTDVVKWLQESSLAAWDVACDGRSFRWDMLTDPGGGAGQARLSAQYLRANVGPTECCVGSPAGSTKLRLGPTGHGFGNLFLAGEAARSGCNTSSVEGAVMTGMAAARAISGEGLGIVGYQFLSLPPSQFFNQE
jgi:uncharacterized protein with NAD-binding domain and iron-sulfur cluster